MDAIREQVPAAKPKKRAKPKKKPDDLTKRLEAAKEITKLFQVERYIYTACCGAAVALLVFCAISLFTDSSKESDWTDKIPVLTALFGSGGLITYSTSRLIFMWNKIIEIILVEKNEKEGEGNEN